MAKDGKNKSPVAEKLSKYRDWMPEKVKWLIIEGGCINWLGDPNWGLIAKILEVTNKTILEWRKRSGKYYREDFARACQEGVEAADAGQVKRGLLNVAKPHIVREKTLELRTVGPKPPPKTWPKADLIEWADKNLDFEIDTQFRKDEVYTLIQKECIERREEKMVVVGEKRKRQVDVGAAKIVLPNIGPKDERWLSKEVRVHEGDTLAAAMAAALKGEDQPKGPTNAKKES